jgi:hypothetical protein
LLIVIDVAISGIDGSALVDGVMEVSKHPALRTGTQDCR